VTPDWRTETKQCDRCGVTFGPNLRLNLHSWRQRRFCSPACTLRPSRPPAEQATCAQCGTLFRSAERGQRFCSRACVYQAQRDEHARQREQMRGG
jgi:hypothetical protein